MKSKKNGFTLTEVLLVLTIAAFIIIGVLIYYNKVSTQSEIHYEESNLITIVSGIKSLYSSTGNYSNLTTQVAINSKVFPEGMLRYQGNTPHNVWKGAVSVTGDKYSLQIKETVPNSEICIKLINDLHSYFYTILVGDTRVKFDFPQTPTLKIDYNLSTVESACNSGSGLAKQISFGAY